MNVAIRNHGAPQNIFYLVQLADVIWLTVPEGAPLVCKGLYNAAREHLVMLPGARVLCGYLWSLRNKREHKFELQDDVFARTGRIDAPFDGFPDVYFPASMLLHADLHLQPVEQRAGGGRNQIWSVLTKGDRDEIEAAARSFS